MENTVEKLYEYFKSVYGVPNTEELNVADDIPKSVTIDVPGVKKNSGEHSFKAFIENGENGEISLIIGECSPDRNTSWSRWLEIIDYKHEHSPYPFLKVTRSMPFRKTLEMKSLTVFINVFESFFRERN